MFESNPTHLACALGKYRGFRAPDLGEFALDHLLQGKIEFKPSNELQKAIQSNVMREKSDLASVSIKRCLATP